MSDKNEKKVWKIGKPNDKITPAQNKNSSFVNLKTQGKTLRVGNDSFQSVLTKPVQTKSSLENLEKVLKSLEEIHKSLQSKPQRNEALKAYKTKKNLMQPENAEVNIDTKYREQLIRNGPNDDGPVGDSINQKTEEVEDKSPSELDLYHTKKLPLEGLWRPCQNVYTEQIADKSQSYDNLNYPKRLTQVSKCHSLETRKLKENQTEIESNKSSQKLLKTASQRYLEEINVAEHYYSYLKPSHVFNENPTDESVKVINKHRSSEVNSQKHPKACFKNKSCPQWLNMQIRTKLPDWKHYVEHTSETEKGPSQTVQDVKQYFVDPAMKYNNLSWQNPFKNIPKTTQVSHARSSNTTRNVRLYHSEETQQSFSNNCKENNPPKKTFQDKETTMEDIDMELRSPKSKTPSTPRLRTTMRRNTVKLKMSEKPKKKDSGKQENKPNVVIWRSENQMQILGQNNQKVKKNVEKKQEKNKKINKEIGKPKEKTIDTAKPKEENNREKIISELEQLEKLFSRLKTVERTLRRRKMTVEKTVQRPTKNTFPEPKEEKTSRSNSTEMNLLVAKDVEEYQRRKRKLRNAVIQHIQTWLQLDFYKC